MTEAEWLDCTDPRPMLRFLLGTDLPRVQALETFPDCIASDRKLRLFACACYHRIRHVIPDVRAQLAVEVAEQVADCVMSENERQRAEAAIREPIDTLEGRWRASRGTERIVLLPTHEALALAYVILWNQAQKAAYYAASNAQLAFAAIANPGAANSDSRFRASQTAEERTQTELLRCIFGPLPFRLNTAPSWLAGSGTVDKLAQSVYEERAFERLPALADALEQSGCDNAEILTHLRGPGPHVRGCWALDLILGKD